MKRKTVEAVVNGALAVLSGLALAGAFPVAGLWGLGWVALSPLLIAASRVPPWRAALLGLTTGLIFHGLCLPWLIGVMTSYGGLGTAVSILVYLLLILYLSVFVSCFSLLVSVACGRFGSGALVVAPFVWVATELLRGILLTGFPWNLLAYCQWENPLVIQTAAFAGAHGVSFLLAAAAALTAIVVIALSRDSAASGTGSRHLMMPSLLLAVLILAALIHGSMRLRTLGTKLDDTVTNQAADPPVFILDLALIQCNVAQSMKMDGVNRREIGNLLQTMTREACAGANTSLVVWPESSIPFLDFRRDSKFRREIEALALDLNIPILLGAIGTPLDPADGPLPGRGGAEGIGAGEGYTNSAFLIDGRGEVVFQYDKIHLVPFGEYVPAADLIFFAGKLVTEVADFTPGSSYAITPVEGAGIACLICYEIVFPSLAREFSRRGADLLLTITNDAWFGDSSAPYQHFAAAVFRAVENGRPVVRCANTGISGCIDPLGRIIRQSTLNRREVLNQRLVWSPLDTLYKRCGEVLAWSCLAFSIALPVCCCRRRTGARQIRGGR